MTLFASPEGWRAARLLEFPELLADVARHAVLARAADRVCALKPSSDASALDRLWAWVRELDRHHENGHALPLGDFVDLQSLLGKEREHPRPLAPEELAAVGAAALTMAKVLDAVERHQGGLPTTFAQLRGCENPSALGEHLLAALEPDGRIQDGASPRLAGLRRALAGAEQSLRETARAQMAKAVQKGWTTGGELVLRGDRYCLPLRAGKRSQVPGIVHDRSDTGQTLFVEPLPVVEASNAVQEGRLAVQEEERRIVLALNQQVAARAPALLDLFERLVELDTVRARAAWGRARKGHSPRRPDPGSRRLVLRGFRHPLLQASLKGAGREEELVPLQLELGASDRVLLISGPNAGGKTVTLKAVGLAVLMAQSGIPLPADDPPWLPVFDRVLMDAGDDQSIANALSSFSAHMTHLREILRETTGESLVLLDEVGGGTDPVEGVALAQAILEHLAFAGGLCLSTTHYGQLKALVHERPGFRNASMAYDQARLQPRFELVLDQPGSSHALEIASRLHLPPGVLDRARELVGEDTLRLEAVLQEMEDTRNRLKEELRGAEASHLGARTEQSRYEELAADLRRRRRATLEAAQREAEGIVRNARARIERLLAQIRGSVSGGDVVEAAAAARADVDRTLEKLARHRVRSGRGRPARIDVGSLVRHAGLDQVGRITEVKGRRVTLEIAGRRVVARADELVAPDDVSAPSEEATAPEGGVRVELQDSTALSRIDVRGMDAEDAWSAVDKALDRCLVSGLTGLEIVHGKGTGRLRETLAVRLRRDPRVRDASVGGGGQYDDGVTVVTL